LTGSVYIFRIQDLKNKHSKKPAEEGGKLSSFQLVLYWWWFLCWHLFDPEDGGDMVNGNVRLPLNYTILQLRRRSVSQIQQGEPHNQHDCSVYHILIVDSHKRSTGV
jgi:hypothetical protein